MNSSGLQTTGDPGQEQSLASEAAALALLVTQHLAAASFLARRLESAAISACQRIADREVLAEPRLATGEAISSEMLATLEVMHQARNLRAELDESLGEALPWCGSMQVRSALYERVVFTGMLQ
jgi:hypothetical protein